MNGGGRKEVVPDVPPMIRMCFCHSLLYFRVGILINVLSMNSDSSKMIYKQDAEGFGVWIWTPLYIHPFSSTGIPVTSSHSTS
jgi:hypothetical protein